MMKFLVVIFAVVCSSLNLLTQADQQEFDSLGSLRGVQAHAYNSYMTLAEMERRIQELKKTYPHRLKVEIAGKSVEGRNIYLVIITQDLFRSQGRSEENDTLRSISESSETFESTILPRKSITSTFSPKSRIPHPNIPVLFPANSPRKTERSEESDDDRDNEDEDTRKEPKSIPLSRPANILPSRRKPVIFVDGGIHAREWVSPAAAFYLIDQLVKSPRLTTRLEWRIMPIVNPDGYHYSWESKSTRMWRKNRAETGNPKCPGVDLNRNFDIHWEKTNHQNPCSETFSGTGPFSEPESRAVRDAVQEVRSRLEAYVTLHTYGQFFLHPFGYSKTRKPHNLEQLVSMANGMAKVIRRKYNNIYQIRQAAIFGEAAGGSDDWAFLKMGATYSYTFELQDKVGPWLNYNSKGFQLPPHKLPQAVDECWLALKYMGEKIMKEKGLRYEPGVRRESTTTVVPTTELITTPLPSSDHTTSTASPSIWDKRKVYPVGWSQVMKEVRKIQMEVRDNAKKNVAQDCLKNGNLFVCPHMIFWGSMFPPKEN